MEAVHVKAHGGTLPPLRRAHPGDELLGRVQGAVAPWRVAGPVAEAWGFNATIA